MKNELSSHAAAYASLMVVAVVFASVFLLYHYDRQIQRIAIASFMVYYVVWGVITHTKSQQVTTSLIFEYIGVAALGGTVLFLLTI